MAQRKAKTIEVVRAEKLVVDHAIKPTTFTWPRAMHQLLREMSSTYTRQRGNPNRSKMLAAAIAHWRIADLSEGDIQEKLEVYRSASVGDIYPKAANSDQSLSEAPYIRFGVRMPHPMHIVLGDLKDALSPEPTAEGAAEVPDTSMQELGATALFSIHAEGLGEAVVGDMLRQYAQITAGELMASEA